MRFLYIDNSLWGEFKALVPRSEKLNDAVVNLIRERVRRNKDT